MSHRGRFLLARRLPAAIVGLVVLLALVLWPGSVRDSVRVLVSPQAAPLVSPQAAPLDSPGAPSRLLVPRGFSVAEIDPVTGQERPLLQADGMILAIAGRAGSSELVYSVLQRKAGDTYAGADLFLSADGQQQALLERVRPDEEFDAPTLTPDSQGIVFQVGGIGVARPSIEYVARNGGQRQVLAQNAEDPTLSGDGTKLAYLQADQAGAIPHRLIVQSLADRVESNVIPPDQFEGVRAPRFSPSGEQIAFLAVSPATDSAPAQQSRPAGSIVPALSDLFQVRVAHAHGPPWDVWVVNADGGEAVRVASLAEDDPSLAWSPDGRALAIFGVNGLWVVPLDGSEARKVAAGGVGRLTWVR